MISLRSGHWGAVRKVDAMASSATSDVEETPKTCIKGPWTVDEDVVLEAYVSEVLVLPLLYFTWVNL